jgi:hypothetical protein
VSLLAECLAAHGGEAVFDRLARVEVRLRCGGLALATKMRADALADVTASVDLHDPRVAFAGFGTWRASDPRPARMPWRFPWRDEDVVHFGGYALWNYVAASFIWRACEARELPRRRLALTFPGNIPTHSRHQTVHLDSEARIARLDYTAEVFGPWARAQNMCLEYVRVAGILIPTRRRVTPRGISAGPTLVRITLDELNATEREG